MIGNSRLWPRVGYTIVTAALLYSCDQPYMRAIWKDSVIAEGDDVVVVDGYSYFRKQDVKREALDPSAHTSTCPWKGQARYYSVRAKGEVNKDAAWEYPNPKEAAASVRDRVAFWKGVRVEP